MQQLSSECGHDACRTPRMNDPLGQFCRQFDPLAPYGVLACGDHSHVHESLMERWNCASPVKAPSDA